MKKDTVRDFYCLMSGIYRDRESILLLVLRLMTEKIYYLNSRDDKNDTFFHDLFCDSSSWYDYTYPLLCPHSHISQTKVKLFNYKA